MKCSLEDHSPRLCFSLGNALLVHPVTEQEAKTVSVLLPGSDEVRMNMKLLSPKKYSIQQPCSSASRNCWALLLCQVLASHSVPLWTFLPSWYLACLAHSKFTFLLFQKLLHISQISCNLNLPSRLAASHRTPKNSFTKLSIPFFHVFLLGLNFCFMWKEREL